MTNPLTVLYPRAFFAGLCVSFKNSRDGKWISLPRTWRRGSRWSQCLGSFTAALILVGTFCAPALAQTLETNWSQLSPGTSPPAGYNSALAYDPVHAQAVLFGGTVKSSGSSSGNTW